jgi:hypothetical protein
LVDEPLQLALREQRAHEVDARERLEVDRPTRPSRREVGRKRLQEPPVLRVAVGVLRVVLNDAGQRIGAAGASGERLQLLHVAGAGAAALHHSTRTDGERLVRGVVADERRARPERGRERAVARV